MSIKVDLNFDILHLNESKFGNAGEIIANHLVSSKDGEPLKYFQWAQALHKGNYIQIDESDFKKLRDFIEFHTGLPILIKAPVLQKLDDAKEISRKKGTKD